MTINDNSTKSINAAIIDLQNQIKQLQHKIGILSKNQLKEDDIEFPGKVEYADEAGKAKEADHAKTADTAKYASETENAVHAGYADNATKATQDGSGNVITDTYATKTELTNGLSGKANTSHNHSAADITSGILAVERGGTGQTTQADINKAIIGELEEGTDVVTDGTMFVSSWASDNGFAVTNATNVPYKRKFSRVWEYIKGKISSVLGITNNKHIIKGETVDTNTYEDVNPKLVFINSDGSQNASLTFTDYDAVQKPASVTLNGNQGGEYFIAPNIKATGKFYGSLDGTADKASYGTFGLLGGAREALSKNFEDLLNNELCSNQSGGLSGGSINVPPGQEAKNLGIPCGVWYNFLYIPHRTGISDQNDDNHFFGTLFVTPMTLNRGTFYIIHRINEHNYSAFRFDSAA